MKLFRITNLVVGLSSFTLMLGVSVAFAEDTGTADTATQTTAVCPADARMCPDGSSVGRTGPNCEFARCPGVPKPPATKPPMNDGTPVRMGVPPQVKQNMSSTTPSKPPMMRPGMGTTTSEKARMMHMGSTTPKDLVKARLMERGFSSTTRPNLSKEEIEKRKENWAEKKNTEKERIKTTARQNVEQIIRRLNESAERLTQIATRVDSRIAKYNSAGVDTTEVQTVVTDAKTALAGAKTGIAGLPGSMATMLASTDPKTEFEAIRGKVEEIKEYLKVSHELLLKAVQMLKEMGPIPGTSSSNNGTSSSTSESTE